SKLKTHRAARIHGKSGAYFAPDATGFCVSARTPVPRKTPACANYEIAQFIDLHAFSTGKRNMDERWGRAWLDNPVIFRLAISPVDVEIDAWKQRFVAESGEMVCLQGPARIVDRTTQNEV
ncbi:MAG TPA: hypothetical protein VF146_01060, partial [Bryobacteraceae bacterium]